MQTFRRFLAVAFTVSLTAFIPNRGDAIPQDKPDLPPPSFEIETRGPVHEAFAQPNEGKVELSVPIAKQPPPAIDERPPEQRPESPTVEWIPGYWAWDSDRSDFLWVTGTFRDPPPGRRWLPGHWTNTAESWRWVPGFWIGENQQDLRYSPEPPAGLENGPPGAAPDENSTYIPGYWYYHADQQSFAWRSGYWAGFRDGRVWVNPQYSWTPNGYTFVDGYWDYPLDNRGMLFAPAYFPTPLWNNPGWSYQPGYGVNLGVFLGSGFYRPGYNHYYFGNYYGNNYAGLGYRPWWGGSQNSLYNYQRWQNRANPQWAAQNQQLFNARMAGSAPLPPSNLAQQAAFVNAKGTPVVSPLNQFAPANGKLVPNTNVASQNFRIQQTNNLANLRAADAKIASSPKIGSAAPTSLRLPPAPPKLLPVGTPSAVLIGSIQGAPTRIGGPTIVNRPAIVSGLPNAARSANNIAPAIVTAPAQVRPNLANVVPAPGNVAAPRIINNAPASNIAAPRIVNNSPAPQIHTMPQAAPINRAPMASPPRAMPAPSMGRAGPAMGGGGARVGGGAGGASRGGGGGGGKR